MERIVKYKTKSVLNPHQIKYLKVNKKNLQNNSNILKKLEENSLKFLNNRRFGDDLTLTLKNGNRALNHKITTKNINQEQNKVNNIYNIFFFYIDTNLYKKTFSFFSDCPKNI